MTISLGGNLVVINLLCADPLPRVSAQEGRTCIRVRVPPATLSPKSTGLQSRDHKGQIVPTLKTPWPLFFGECVAEQFGSPKIKSSSFVKLRQPAPDPCAALRGLRINTRRGFPSVELQGAVVMSTLSHLPRDAREEVLHVGWDCPYDSSGVQGEEAVERSKEALMLHEVPPST